MKLFLLLSTLLTVFFCFLLNMRLENTEAELTAARGKIKATEEQRVPQVKLDTTER